MSADISSLPPWKQELLDKKRRQEEEERKKKAIEEDRLSKMPPWKRDIILRKQQQKNSLVFISKGDASPRSDVSSNGDISSLRLEDNANYTDETDELSKTVLNHSMNSDTGLDSKPVEEHLIPIQQNPWVRTEMHWKKSKSHHKLSGRREHNDENYINYTDHSGVSNHNIGYETDGYVDRAITSNDLDEDIFTEPEEEVHYGRGFVDRLRQKFSHLSTNDRKRPHSVANVNLSPKHSRSTDSILDEVSKPIPRSISTSDDVDYFVKASIFSPPKARSMENLLSEKAVQSQQAFGEKDSQDLRKIPSNIPKSVSMGNDVSHQLPTNDVEGVSGISYRSGENNFAAQKGIKIRSSELYVEELPRANIVSATRTLFEGSGQKEGAFRRSVSPEPISQFSEDQNSSNILDNDYIHADNTSNGVQKDALANNIDSSTHHHRVNKPNASTSDLTNHFSGGTSGEQSQDTLQSVRSSGKVWYSSGTEPPDTSPRNVEYGILDKNNYYTDSRFSGGRPPRTAVTADNQRANSSYHGSQVQPSSSEHADQSSSIINHKNQRNADLSLTFERSAKDSIYSTSESSAARSPTWTKKRSAPEPPNETHTRKHAGFIDLKNGAEFSELKDNESPVNKSDRTKLHLDFSGSQNDAQGEDLFLKEAAESSPSYRDLYFSSKKDSTSASSSGSSVKLDLSGTQESVVDDDDEHLLKKSSTSGQGSVGTTHLSESTDSGIGSDSTESHSHDSGATPAVPGSEKHSRLSASNINNVPAADNRRPTPPNSLPENKKNISVNLQGESRRVTPPSSINIAEGNNIKNKDSLENGDSKKSKRPAPQGPGMLLIRPASNLVSGGQTSNNQFLQITRYNDVKTGTFEPAKKRSNYGAVGDVPITNIDDMLDDVPVTNIDDMGYSPDSSPRNNEIDSDTLRRQAAKKYEFIGAEVSLGKSLLARTRTKKVRF